MKKELSESIVIALKTSPYWNMNNIAAVQTPIGEGKVMLEPREDDGYYDLDIAGAEEHLKSLGLVSVPQDKRGNLGPAVACRTHIVDNHRSRGQHEEYETMCIVPIHVLDERNSALERTRALKEAEHRLGVARGRRPINGKFIERPCGANNWEAQIREATEEEIAAIEAEIKIAEEQLNNLRLGTE